MLFLVIHSNAKTLQDLIKDNFKKISDKTTKIAFNRFMKYLYDKLKSVHDSLYAHTEILKTITDTRRRLDKALICVILGSYSPRER